MKALLVRVGIDCTDGGNWNGSVDSKSGDFVYVPTAETKSLRDGFERFYDELQPALMLVLERTRLAEAFAALPTHPDLGLRNRRFQTSLAIQIKRVLREENGIFRDVVAIRE